MPNLLNFLREGQKCSEQNASIFPQTYEDGVGGDCQEQIPSMFLGPQQVTGGYKVKVLAVGGNRFS